MPRHRMLLTATLAIGLMTVTQAHAHDDVEGVIESLDSAAQTLTVAGKTIYTDEKTDYDDGLTEFSDLQVGDRVEVDFKRDGDRLIATEIELEGEDR